MAAGAGGAVAEELLFEEEFLAGQPSGLDGHRRRDRRRRRPQLQRRRKRSLDGVPAREVERLGGAIAGPIRHPGDDLRGQRAGRAERLLGLEALGHRGDHRLHRRPVDAQLKRRRIRVAVGVFHLHGDPRGGRVEVERQHRRVALAVGAAGVPAQLPRLERALEEHRLVEQAPERDAGGALKVRVIELVPPSGVGVRFVTVRPPVCTSAAPAAPDR